MLFDALCIPCQRSQDSVSVLKVLTPTFKLQRNKAKDKYQAVSTHEAQSSHESIDGFVQARIDELYAELEAVPPSKL